jgi:subtilisin family serine protease
MEELIVKYTGDLTAALASIPEATATLLLGGYAIIRYPDGALQQILALPEVQYAQPPVQLYFEDAGPASASCITTLTEETGLTGRGVLVAILDSGVDVAHKAFLTPDGRSRFLYYWDQTAGGNPPKGYAVGTAYTGAELDELLSSGNEDLLPKDPSGHGTAVLGIAAGSDPAAGYTGIAPQADLLGVRLGKSAGYPRTSQLMEGVNYCVECALRLARPLVINLSFGNSYGDHTGQSLLEDYLNLAASYGKTCIVAGTGNEGASGLHVGGLLQKPTAHLLSLGAYQSQLNLQLWKAFAQELTFSLTAPNGDRTGPLDTNGGVYRFTLDGAAADIIVGLPTPIQLRQGIYIELSPETGEYLPEGIWTISLSPLGASSDRYDLWLPVSETLGDDTRFLSPDPQVTLTIPSTASALISVGSYNGSTDTLSAFSGRGYTALGAVKPDLLAPGEGLLAPQAGTSHSLYAHFTGTSFAAPVVSGSAALLMEWGIVRGHDPNLFGQKIKAYLQKGARPLTGETDYPNPRSGYGSLCLFDTYKLLQKGLGVKP